MPRYIPQIIGAGELQRKTATILREVSRSDQESFIVTHNEPQAVIMSIMRYERLKAVEGIEFIPHQKKTPRQIRASFENTGRYSKEFLHDLEEGLKKSSIYLKKSRKKK